ncbi:Rab6b [Monocercomonoides exilis]|uniref:Rab6b n=1 Tax=Monocercomonoides exilis TaxID=2049356 RepID=UPI00355A11E4|nr:Rab6b [Monocercomonoides exilis]|eukprot:MONOS_2174.1-p1 / transcript=MONOS_2174.1 / gene=MONOS_2174 / organism=Monocercomonoides_exilis_PA203 / gene_product=Rab6b / transcript_product=Rab6b / location=Mono_scaffold00043:57489-58419(+) / protein_length=217 / sequence_SO=supercontig / SO=protein_coding / is_pseudo=false
MSGIRQYKIIFLGDQGVGKTSLIARFMYDSFDLNYQPTVGIDFLSKSVAVDGRAMKLHLWDTAGQERFKALIPSYLRDTSAAIVLYDITRRPSFDNVESWIDQVRNERGENALIYIVGAKTDLSSQRAVTTNEGEEFARKLQCQFYEVSSRTGEGVDELFRVVSASLVRKTTTESVKSRTEPPTSATSHLQPADPVDVSANQSTKAGKSGKNCGCM